MARADGALLRHTSDLDGGYLWLGITGAATRADGSWDSTFGGDAAVLRVRERSALAITGVGLTGTRMATEERWRLSLDGVAGTRIAGVLAGVAIGPSLDLARVDHARAGATATAWVFAGITPFVRVGVLVDGTAYIDIGARLGFPVTRF
jgi:hypothetical protein